MRIATTYLGDARSPAPLVPLPEAISTAAAAVDAPMISRILALGGHDFTSRPPDRAVCELMLRLATERAGGPAEDLHPADRQRRHLRPDRPLLRGLRRARLRALRPLALPARPPPGRAPRPPARTGPGLRRRRQPRQPARGLGGARPRRDAQPRLAPGDRARRPERRRDVLVRGRDHQIVGPPGGRRRPRPARRQPLRPLQQRARAPRRLPRGGRRRDAGRLRPRRLRRAALGGQRPPLGGHRPPRRPRLPGHAGDEGVAEEPIPARFLPAPAPATLREDIAEFRRITGMRKRAGWLG